MLYVSSHGAILMCLCQSTCVYEFDCVSTILRQPAKQSPTQPAKCLHAYPLIHSSTHPLIHPPTHPPTHSFTHPFIHPPTHPSTYSSTYSPNDPSPTLPITNNPSQSPLAPQTAVVAAIPHCTRSGSPERPAPSLWPPPHLSPSSG